MNKHIKDDTEFGVVDQGGARGEVAEEERVNLLEGKEVKFQLRKMKKKRNRRVEGGKPSL